MSVSLSTPAPVLLDVKAVASRLGCCTRHVWRLRDQAKMPPSVEVGALVRWNSEVIDDWIRRGCPPHRRQAVRS
jgi:predicted DNA-binding transcriptional regulator AlpA